MRNQPLTGYLLHHKPYQENRALYYFFTPTHGVVHGIGKKGMPLFSHIQLFATGKRSLKSFSQIQPVPMYYQKCQNYQNLASQVIDTDDSSNQTSNHLSFYHHSGRATISQNAQCPIGQNLYAGFYLNEILWKLLANEDPMPKLWQYYHVTLSHLRVPINSTELKLLLRHFELALFTELGYGFRLTEDNQGAIINAELWYRFLADEGFVSVSEHNPDIDKQQFSTISLFSGESLLAIAHYLHTDSLPIDEDATQPSTLSHHHLQTWSRLHKFMIDHLIDYQPLKSRELWRQFIKYR